MLYDINCEKAYDFDEEKLLNVEGLPIDDPVRAMIEDQGICISLEDIENERDARLEDYNDGGCITTIGYGEEVIIGEDFSDLQHLEFLLDAAIEIEKCDETYNMLLNKANELGYCG